jgi:DNA mismatch repair protein MutS2
LLPEIVSEARAEISPTDLQAEDLLDEIHRQRDLARAARHAAEAARMEAEAIREELTVRLDNVEDERRALLEEARVEAEEKVKAVRKELKKLRREMRQYRQPIESIKEIEERVQEMEEQVETPIERRVPDVPPGESQGPIRLGSKVRLRTLGNEGVVTALSEDEAEVQIGVLRIRARLAELELKSKEQVVPPQKQPADVSRSFIRHHESPGIELDMRGQRAEDALATLDNYLERAYLAKLPWVRIIHGKGTGKLRRVVREALSQHPHITSYENGKQAEGGDGVTVARLRT